MKIVKTWYFCTIFGLKKCATYISHLSLSNGQYRKVFILVIVRWSHKIDFDVNIYPRKFTKCL